MIADRENLCAKVRTWPPGRRTRRGRHPAVHPKPSLSLGLLPGGGGENLVYSFPDVIPEGFDAISLRFKPAGSSTYSELLTHDPDLGTTIPIEGLFGCYRAVAVNTRGKWISKPSNTVRVTPDVILSNLASGDRRYFPTQNQPTQRTGT